MSFDTEYLKYSDIKKKAEIFLNKYNSSNEIPVPIEEIIEMQLEIDIIPMPGLKENFSYDTNQHVISFISSDMKEIQIDEKIYEKFETRYRFSLAHEMGHWFLHKSFFDGINFSTMDTWKATLNDIPQEKYIWLERQADNFAGCLLVPTKELQHQTLLILQEIKTNCINLNISLIKDYLIPQLSSKMVDIFNVSQQVIEIRLNKEKIVDKFLKEM